MIQLIIIFILFYTVLKKVKIPTFKGTNDIEAYLA